jgi:hypothetical protein
MWEKGQKEVFFFVIFFEEVGFRVRYILKLICRLNVYGPLAGENATPATFPHLGTLHAL